MTRDNVHGCLVVFEGPDGAGKTALTNAVVEELIRQGEPCEYFSFPGREAGTLGHLVYEVHHEPENFSIDYIEPASLQVLHVAAHLDAIARRILPTLKAGRSVILDRFWWSTVVYGIVGGVDRSILDAMIDLELRVWGAVEPDVAFLVTRHKPLRKEGSDEQWQHLRDAYGELAREQARRYPVETVVNEGTLDEALDQVMRVLEGEDGL